MDLIDELDKVLLQHEKREKTNHYPSECTACARQAWYKWKGREPSNPIEAGALWKMGMGNSIHKIIPDLLRGAGYEVEEEVEVFLEHPALKYPIKGRIDVRFRDGEAPWEILEVKSSYGRGIQNIQQSGAPKEDHYNQLVLYLHMSDCRKGYLFYLGRDNAYRTIFTIQKNDETEHRFRNLLMRFQIVEHYLSDNELPPREYVASIVDGKIKDKFQHKGREYKGDWNCSYCGYRDECWGVKNKIGKWHGEVRIV